MTDHPCEWTTGNTCSRSTATCGCPVTAENPDGNCWEDAKALRQSPWFLGFKAGILRQVTIFSQLERPVDLIGLSPAVCDWCKNKITDLEQRWLEYVIDAGKNDLSQKGVDTSNVHYRQATFDEFKV